jgi:hypothetical protein
MIPVFQLTLGTYARVQDVLGSANLGIGKVRTIAPHVVREGMRPGTPINTERFSRLDRIEWRSRRNAVAGTPERQAVRRDAFLITLRASGLVRRLTASTEREAALAAESVVRLHCDAPGGIGFVIDAADASASRRIAAYLSDVMAETSLSAFVAQASAKLTGFAR